jgi:regulator of sigma E protease
MSILFYAIVAFGILIFFHELGHFIIAKATGVKVLKLALGFGPKIIGRKIGETEYNLCAIPLGGYCKLLGEDPEEIVDERDEERSFNNKSIACKIGIVTAGPAFNIFLAIAIVWFIFLGKNPYIKTEIDEVLEGYPAHEAGLQKGDMIVSINDKEVHRWNDLAKMVATSEGKTLNIEYIRNGKRFKTKIVPRAESMKTEFGDEVEVYRIGVTSTKEVLIESFGPFKALRESILWTWDKISFTVSGLIKIVQGKISIKTLGSPILIGKMAGDQAKLGPSNYFFFIALISVILAIMNLLPIPVLDGGHILFFLIEAFVGKPIGIKVRGIANYIGIFILGCIMALAVYNDINRFMSKEGPPKVEAPAPAKNR